MFEALFARRKLLNELREHIRELDGELFARSFQLLVSSKKNEELEAKVKELEETLESKPDASIQKVRDAISEHVAKKAKEKMNKITAEKPVKIPPHVKKMAVLVKGKQEKANKQLQAKRPIAKDVKPSKKEAKSKK